MTTQLARKLLRWCWRNCSVLGIHVMVVPSSLTLGSTCSWDTGGLVGHYKRGWYLFHRGDGMSGGVWGGAVAVSIDWGTIGAAFGSSVGFSGGGATLGNWGVSALGSGSESSLGPCHGSGAGSGAGTTLIGAAACVANILASQRRASALLADGSSTGTSGEGWRRSSVRYLVVAIARSEKGGAGMFAWV